MVDIHCHILPAVDDGARSWEIAEQMCQMAAADGIRHTVATPHANDEYRYDREQHTALLEKLRPRAGRLQLSLGCDFHFSYDNVQDCLHNSGRYVIRESRYLLVEFSDFAIPRTVHEDLGRLMESGLVPIITHPERNPILQRHPEQVLRFAEEGCVIQVTGNSLAGRWGEGALRCSQWLLARDAVHVLASDAHDLKSRPPVLSPAREAAARLCGHDVAAALVDGNPSAIIANQVLPFCPMPALEAKQESAGGAGRRSLLSRLFRRAAGSS